MRSILASPLKALGLGIAIAAAVLVIWLLQSRVDPIGFTSFLLRFLHIISAMIWVGMIWFVNFIQLVAIGEAEPAARSAILKHIVPKVALTFRHASHLTILSGVLLLVTTGYLLDRWVFSAPYGMPPLKNVLLWTSTLGALAMYGFVHMAIWPSLRIVLGETPADTEAVARAREKVALFARWNLVLAIPVTFAMVAAAHLY